MTTICCSIQHAIGACNQRQSLSFSLEDEIVPAILKKDQSAQDRPALHSLLGAARCISTDKPLQSSVGDNFADDHGLVGNWKTNFGSYDISSRNSSTDLLFRGQAYCGSPMLSGILKPDNDWYVGRLKELGSRRFVGDIRLRLEDDGAYSMFTPENAGASLWSQAKFRSRGPSGEDFYSGEADIESTLLLPPL